MCGDLLAQRGQVVEDQDELPLGDVLGLACADRLLGRLEQCVDGFRGDPLAAGVAQDLADLVCLGDEVGRGQADLADEFLGGRQEGLAEHLGVFGEDAVHQGVGEAFHVAGGAEQPLAVPHPEAEFGGLLVGHAGGAGLAGQDQSGDAGRVDAVVAVLADLGPLWALVCRGLRTTHS